MAVFAIQRSDELDALPHGRTASRIEQSVGSQGDLATAASDDLGGVKRFTLVDQLGHAARRIENDCFVGLVWVQPKKFTVNALSSKEFSAVGRFRVD